MQKLVVVRWVQMIVVMSKLLLKLMFYKLAE